MSSIPDLISLLCLDSKHSRSPFGGSHRTVLIERDFSNLGDFAFNNFLSHFGRKEPETSVLLISLSHEWTNYSAIAAKCGFNLRRDQNSGNIVVLSVMSEYLKATCENDKDFNPCLFVQRQVESFIDRHSSTADLCKNVPIVMLDDLSILTHLNSQPKEVYNLFIYLDQLMRCRTRINPSARLSYLIIQSMHINLKKIEHSKGSIDTKLNHLLANIVNSCDITLVLRPLETGHSTRVDGTIKIIDNRLPISARADNLPSLFPRNSASIGVQQAFFYKVSDRRVRLTTSAVIF